MTGKLRMSKKRKAVHDVQLAYINGDIALSECSSGRWGMMAAEQYFEWLTVKTPAKVPPSYVHARHGGAEVMVSQREVLQSRVGLGVIRG